ncbi:MAG: hypothetical protein ACLTT1_05700 [[Clostridium] scindens]
MAGGVCASRRPGSRQKSINARQQLNMAMSKAQLELKEGIEQDYRMELKKELFEEVDDTGARVYEDGGLSSVFWWSISRRLRRLRAAESYDYLYQSYGCG